MEGVASSQRFSGPITTFVPAFYNERRIFTIMDWLRSEVCKINDEHGSARRVNVGRAVAMTNMAFWVMLPLGTIRKIVHTFNLLP